EVGHNTLDIARKSDANVLAPAPLSVCKAETRSNALLRHTNVSPRIRRFHADPAASLTSRDRIRRRRPDIVSVAFVPDLAGCRRHQPPVESLTNAGAPNQISPPVEQNQGPRQRTHYSS